MQNPSLKTMFDMTGKVTMVTGGCQNLGLEIATGLAELGANLIVTSRSADKATKCAAGFADRFGVEALGLDMNLTNEDSVVSAFDRALDTFGGLDGLVNNAGGHGAGTTGTVDQEPLEYWNGYISANLTGTFLCIREFARRMIPKRTGSIVNIASISSLLGRDRSVYDGCDMIPNAIPYTAAKAGVIGLTYDCAAYLGQFGIRVNAVSPGGFERGQPQPFIDRYSAKTMLGRMGRDGCDLKGAVAFLVSDAAAYVTGHNLYVDGGFSRFN